ncbi:MAG: sugar nucleotidyltransferase [Candidatus Diapherotrites archaeon]|nr:sugar nucleotidyltransferase [Candidatus Diapherotrites archaeon]
MKGVILAGGTGSRLRPLTLVTNKHLLPIYDKPMIYYPIEALKSAGIKDIMVVTGTNHAGDIFGLLGSGKDFGVKFTYRVQDEAGGIPSAISLAEDFVGKDRFISINGDNIIFEPLKQFAGEFEKGREEARIMLFEGTVEEARKSGVAVLDGDKVVKLVEKPKEPPSRLISIGIYMFSPSVFDVIRKLRPSARGETEITEVNNEFLKKGTLKASRLKGKWLDAGDFEDLLNANLETKRLAGKGQ